MPVHSAILNTGPTDGLAALAEEVPGESNHWEWWLELRNLRHFDRPGSYGGGWMARWRADARHKIVTQPSTPNFMEKIKLVEILTEARQVLRGRWGKAVSVSVCLLLILLAVACLRLSTCCCIRRPICHCCSGRRWRPYLSGHDAR